MFIKNLPGFYLGLHDDPEAYARWCFVTATNAFASFQATGNAEDISDIIYNVDPFDTPGLSKTPEAEATNTTHQWQTDGYATAVSSNQSIEGEDATADASTATTLVTNACEIPIKVPRVTTTQQAIKHYGRDDEMAYQIEKRAVEMKRDMETSIWANKAKVVTRTTSVAGVLGGLPTYVNTNTSRAGDGVNGSGAGVAVRTDGTARPLTEDLVQDMLQLVWQAGGNPDAIYLGGYNKRRFSTFAGNATRMKTAEDRKLMAAIDIYESDWGEMELIPDRFMRTRDLFAVQTDMLGIAYLISFTIADLSRTGLSERKQLYAEFTLEVRNEKSLGAVYDLTASN